MIHFTGITPVLLPRGMSAQELREINDSPSHPYFLLARGRDDGPWAMKVNVNAFFANADCGTEAENSCSCNGLNPNQVLRLGEGEPPSAGRARRP